MKIEIKNSRWNKTSNIVVGLVASLSCFVAIDALNSSLKRKPAEDRSINLKSEGKIVQKGDATGLCATEFVDMVISGKFLISELKDYQNVFQTAGINSGVRYEIGRQGNSGVILGSPTNLYNVLVAKDAINLNTEYQFDFQWNSDGYAKFFLNNKLQDEIRLTPSPLCTNLLAGGGFDEQRSLVGTTELTFEARAYEPRNIIPNVFRKLFLLTSVVFTGFFILKKHPSQVVNEAD